VPEGFRAELINGEIILSPSSKSLHWFIQLSLFDQFRPLGWTVAADQTIVHPEYGDEPRPDFLLLGDVEIDPDEHLPGDHVKFVVEVLSKSNKGTDLLDKVEIYAKFGIPQYLIIDPFKGECLLYLHPRHGAYSEKRVTHFGEPVDLPEPIGFTLSTTGFGTYKRA